MKKESISLSYTLFDSVSELPAGDRLLLEKAAEATEKAYAPYSHFRVGAAIRLQNGTVLQGNNQENAAYPSGLCAERVVLFYASALYPDVPVEAIAITVHAHNSIVDQPIPPCGACRQVMAEMESRLGTSMRVIMKGQSGKVMVADQMKDLLPFSFLPEHLPSKKNEE